MGRLPASPEADIAASAIAAETDTTLAADDKDTA
jgi:hypothetical protein